MNQIKSFNKEDKERILQFNKLVHGEEDLTVVNTLMFKNPFQGLNKFVYIEDEGKIASMAGLLKHKQRFGNKEVEVGEIGLVGTHPEYRKKGLCSEIMNYWFDYMKEKRIPLCYLYGIANFYQQFGFEYAVPAHFSEYVTIEKELLKDIKGSYSIEEVKIEDDNLINEINEVYHKCTVENFCTESRALEYFKYRIKSTSVSNHKWYVIKDENKIKGYGWFENCDEKLTIKEANIIDNDSAKTLCEFLYNLVKEKENITNIGVKSPLNNPFAKFLYKKGGKFSCVNEIFPGTWAGMYKIIDVQAALEILKESFQERLKESKFYNFKGDYKIVTEKEKVVICIDNSKVTISKEDRNCEAVKIPINILTSVYTGYKGIEYYEEEIGFSDERAKEIFKVLFPIGNPYIWDLEMSDEMG